MSIAVCYMKEGTINAVIQPCIQFQAAARDSFLPNNIKICCGVHPTPTKGSFPEHKVSRD
jgi:hypothetical protein